MVSTTRAGWWVARATRPLGVEAGLSASMTAAVTRTTRATGSSRRANPATRWPAGVAQIAARSTRTPAARASSTSLGPSRSTVEPRPAS